MLPIALLGFATWNVRGLTKTDKQCLLANDCDRYDLDIIGIQETKICQFEDKKLPGNHRLLLFDQKTGRHGGLGFLINARVNHYFRSFHQISDRVAFMDFYIPSKFVNKPPCKMRIVNCYSPTNPKTLSNPAATDQFYYELQEAINVPARHEIWILGDFNAKLGKRSDHDFQNGLHKNIGRHGVGRRNENGERLLNFLVSNGLFAANTAFRHSSRHITTRTGWVKDKRTKRSFPYFSQIDYVLCRSRSTVFLNDARAYAGAKLHSDHKIVKATIDLRQQTKLYRNRTSAAKRYNTTSLVCNKELQDQYQQTVTQQIDSLPPSADTKTAFEQLFETIKSSASNTVGVKKKTQRHHHSSDQYVCNMSNERHKLLQELNDNSVRDRTVLRKRINRLKNDINKRLKELETALANQLADTINAADDTKRMFEATRALAANKETEPISVFNSKNQLVASDDEKASIIREWFKNHYTSSDPPLVPFTGPPRPLNTPITSSEVQYAASKLKNGKAVGPDEIPNELLKYAPPVFFQQYACLINRSFEEHEHVPSFTEGFLTPLQKPGKPKGPLKSLRPLCLLNGTRKLLSLITLHRIQRQIAEYTGPWQNAYKAGHSCANIVWTQRILISVVKEKRWEFHKMGIDMSSAFDTIKRSVILELLADAGCCEDDIRLARYLLSNTKLRIKINNTISLEFETSEGSFQGDAASGAFFTLYFAGALYHFRAVVMIIRPNPPFNPETLMPIEWEYADDGDFADEDEDTLREMLPICKEILEEWNLFVNEDKTEHVHFYIADKDEVDAKGEPVKNREPWRNTISLGSRLCSKADISRRCILAYAAFEKYSKVWAEKSRISLPVKIKLYEAFVTPVLLYNCNSWAAPQNIINKVDVCQRKHLRRIINMTYPRIISNKDLYARCNVTPLSERVHKARWKMFGHILRSDCNSPPQLALSFAVDSMSNMRGRIGRHQCNIFKTILDDLNKRNIYLNNSDDLTDLRHLASNRQLWRNLF